MIDGLRFVVGLAADVMRRRASLVVENAAALRDALTTLGMNGWYPDDEMELPDLLEFARRFEAGEEEKTNDRLHRGAGDREHTRASPLAR